MPRPNPPRSLQGEDNLAQRIAYEREQRGWTYEGLAKRLTDVGCPIQGSAIYKIEKGTPRRRISVDELVAFAKVFDADTSDLLIPLELIAEHEALALLGEVERKYQVLTGAAEDYSRAMNHIAQLAAALDDKNASKIVGILYDRLRSILVDWVSVKNENENDLNYLLDKTMSMASAAGMMREPAEQPDIMPIIPMDEATTAEYAAAQARLEAAHKEMWAVVDRAKAEAVARGEYQETT